MKLSAATDLMMPGDALLFEGTAPFSRAIERHTHSKYSHVAMVGGYLPCGGPFHDLTQIVVIEALEHKGVRMYPLARYLKECADEGCRVDWYSLSAHWRRTRHEMVNYAVQQVGDHYGMKQLLWSFLLLPRLLRKLFRKLPLAVKTNQWFCSQLYAGAAAQSEFELPKAAALMTPADVAALPFLTYRDSLVL